MKKFLLLLIALGIGFVYWFMQPEQQIKRKTKRVLSMFTVSEESAPGRSQALFADSLFATKIKLQVSSNIARKIPRLNSYSLNRDTISMASQNVSNTFKQLEHSINQLEIKKLSDAKYQAHFQQKIELKLKKVPVYHTLNCQTTFTFEKKADKLVITTIELK